MLNVSVIGQDALIDRFTRMPENLHTALVKTMTSLSIKLWGLVQSKVQGPVLNKRSGNLLRSIHWDWVEDSPAAVVSKVFSDGSVKYAAVHEFGGLKSYVIEPVDAKALAFQIGGQLRFFKKVVHPPLKERSYMRSSLTDMAAEIKSRLNATITKTAQTGEVST